ncbi:MAG: double-strand break repair helicase AddA [Alphaproteobacteria bacterium]|nr:double-strand break repair helicase AddA [Alphaproteobacteria bacterium]
MAEERLPLAAEPSRPTDPNVLQRQASDPAASVWVGASAGTGKTKVLTDRVLRLLLPVSADEPGTRPHKILCLTFTKAGASEMTIRVAQALSRWAVMEEGNENENGSLRYELKALLGRAAEDYEVTAARKLFASVVDHPGGLPIMTIHAFCQSLLGRFPLEAGLTPHFKILEEGPAAELLQEARLSVLNEARATPGSPLAEALDRLARALNEEQFFNLLADIQSERRQFSGLLQKHFGAEGLYTALCQHLDIPAGREGADMLREACADGAFDEAGLVALARAFGQGTPATDQPKALQLRSWLDATIEQRAASFDDYALIYLKQEGDVRAKILTAKLAASYPAEADRALQEAERLQEARERAGRAESALLSRALFTLAEAIATRYQELKERQGALDFDDLILHTLALLKGGTQPGLANMSGWVNYKLDQGLDHLLVDEAQDTNPEQWEILEALCDDFFSGEGSREAARRSVFVVGDHKQSIYSFQRASPREFARMKGFFAAKLKEAGGALEDVGLNISFRSAPSVLKLVDAVFADEESRKGLGLEDVRHESFRRNAAGLVEIWPLCESPKREKRDYWQLSLLDQAANKEEAQESGAVQLARRIADTVAGWLARGEELPSRGRAIRPGDIMILLKNRKKGAAIVQALKSRGIPVGGADRMVLGEQLAVEDMLAAASFALLPEDDLTLACLLKSPLVGVSEEALFELAYGRRGALWGAVKEKAAPEVTRYLERLIEKARQSGPYAFFSYVLNMPCPASERSGLAAMQARLGRHALDPLEELLSAAQGFESSHTASLPLFLSWQQRQQGEIKREMESAGDDNSPGFVRIMTVHGSKGLQAPIVIVPDTVRAVKAGAGQNQRRLLWPHQGDTDLPLWSPRKDTDFKAFKEAMARLEEKEDEEYRRLLYVALTRAEDRLYIGGAAGTKGALPESWYFHVRRGFEAMEGVEPLEDGTLRYHNVQLGAPDRPAKSGGKAVEALALPGWAITPPAPEPAPPRPLAPSRPSLPDQTVRSPLETSRNEVFLRGNLTHKLLQFLPDLGKERREAAGGLYLERSGAALDKAVQAEILAEVLAVLDHPEFAALFGLGSQAEVPVSGFTADGTLVSGQIDRLLVTDDKILIVDYKTNRAPPAEAKDIPEIYIRQMRSYAALLRAIYPGREVAAALIWTDGLKLMPVDAA